jgi:hypothetical protein
VGSSTTFILYWKREEGDIRHPVAIQKLQLTFDALIPEFTIRETGQPPELLRPLLFATQEAAAHTIQQADDELSHQDIDLLDIRKIEDPLRRIAAALHSEGQFVGATTVGPKEYPQITCDPVIYLHRRTQGFAIAVDFVLQDLVTRTDLPPGLLRISGLEPPVPELAADSGSLQLESPPEILFTKEANEEQFQIADRLNRYNNVLVQGPPGTGKTHTIANLIGHLLAHGKRVLVTAHTSKALRVLRDKVAAPLQTLCVSVLDNETESRKQLEASVDEMVARLTSENPAFLDREADALEQERRRLLGETVKLRQELIEARQDEYRDLIVAGAAISPSEAARFVSRSKAQNSWIPEPIEVAVPAPLSGEEVHELYSTKARLTVDDERELRRWRPSAGDVPGGEEFARESERWRELQDSDRETGEQLWSEDARWDADSEELADIDRPVRDSVGLLADAPLWKLDAVAAGLKGLQEALSPWTELIQRLGDPDAVAGCFSGVISDVPHCGP